MKNSNEITIPQNAPQELVEILRLYEEEQKRAQKNANFTLWIWGYGPAPADD